MATYTVKLPDGGTLKMEGPEGATDEQVIAQAQKLIATERPKTTYARPIIGAPAKLPASVAEAFGQGPSLSDVVTGRKPSKVEPIGGYGMLDSIVHGATLGADSMAMGAAGTLMNAVAAPFSDKIDFDPAGAFNRSRQGHLDAADQYSAEHPWLSGGGGVLGAFIGGPGKALESAGANAGGFLSRLLKSAGVGGASGAVNAANNSRQWSDVPGNVVGGGLAGSLVGAALPVAGALAAPLVKAGRIALNKGQGLAIERVASTLGNDMVSPAQAGSLMDEAAKLGVPRVLGDTGENTARLLGATARQPGQARSMVRNFLKDRQRGQGERLQNAITRDLGPVGNVADQSDAIMEAARQRAAPLYEKSNANVVPDTPELQALLATPAGKAALERAHTIAANERVNPKDLGFSLDDSGAVVLNPPNVALHGEIASTKAALDTATAALQRAQRAGLGGGGVAGEVPRLQSEVERLQGAYDTASQALNDAPSAGVAATQPVHSQRTLDYVKRGLDSVLEDSRDKVTGKLKLDDVGRSVDNVRKDFLRVVDSLNPDYPAARAEFAGPAKEADALRLGQEMTNASEGDILRATSRMNASEKAQFALGMRSKLSDNLSRRTDLGNKVDYLSNTPQRRDVLQQVAGPEADLGRFQNTLGHEDAAQQTYGIAMNGSPTAINLADDAINEDAGLAQDVLGRFMRGSKNGLWSGVTNAAAPLLDASRFGVGATGDRVRQEIAALLTESDPRVFQSVLDELAARKKAGSVRAGRLALQGSNVLGTTAGGYVSTLGQ